MSGNVICICLFAIGIGAFSADCMQKPSAVKTDSKSSLAAISISRKEIEQKVNSPCFINVYKGIAFTNNPEQIELVSKFCEPKFSDGCVDMDFKSAPLGVTIFEDSSVTATSSTGKSETLEVPKSLLEAQNYIDQIQKNGGPKTDEEVALFFIKMAEVYIESNGSLEILNIISQRIINFFFRTKEVSVDMQFPSLQYGVPQPKTIFGANAHFKALASEYKIMLLWNIFTPKSYIFHFLLGDAKWRKILKDSFEDLSNDLGILRYMGFLLYDEIKKAGIALNPESNLMGLLKFLSCVK